VETKKFTYRQTTRFTRLITDYLDANEQLSDLYKYSLQSKAIQDVINNKVGNQPNRKLLLKLLNEQYEKLTKTTKVEYNINALKLANTFCITSAHQPLLLGGPMYFIYKIISTIKLARQLNAEYPNYHFVPVFWLGGEDHDFPEVNHAHLFGETLRWETANNNGPVGRMSIDSLAPVLNQFNKIIQGYEYAGKLINLFSGAYSPANHKNFNEATRIWLHDLFGEYGLLIIDADDKRMKADFVEVMKRDLFQHDTSKIMQDTLQWLSHNYKVQAKPRDINLFYMKKNMRERIVYHETRDSYEVLNTTITFSKTELQMELENYPERFSPNVILRPLYQEKILPDLIFIGGAGELAYWLELKDLFDANNISYPMLLLRDSFTIVNKEIAKKIDTLKIPWSSVFKESEALIKELLISQDADSWQLIKEKEHLKDLYLTLKQKASKIDKSLEGAMEGALNRSLKELENLEHKMMKAVKQKRIVDLQRLEAVKKALFPENNLQERYDNFSMYFARYGDQLIEMLMNAADPLERKFKLLIEK